MKNEGSILVSIIIPVYNVEKYIRQCLESVICQTYENLEILCIDDCGQDNTVTIIEEFSKRDRRIKIVKHVMNMGAAVARNTGINTATGEFLSFVDSDDMLGTRAIEDMFHHITKTRGEVVWANTEVIAESGGTNQRMLDVMNYLSYVPLESKIQVDINNFSEVLDRIPCVPWNKLFKKEFLNKNKIYFIDARLPLEDEGFHVKLLANLPLINHLDRVCYYHRIRTSSVMGALEGDSQSRVDQLRLIIDDAISYLNKHEKSEFIELVKARPLYRHCYATKAKKSRSIFSKLIRIRIRKNHKRLQIFGITLYESKR